MMLLLSRGFLSDLLALIIFVMGSILGIWALFYNRVGNFNIQPKMRENAELITRGIYGYIRHPMYLAVIMMMLGFFLATPTLFMGSLFSVLIVVLLLKAKREEQLWVASNDRYIQYQRETKFFIPYIL